MAGRMPERLYVDALGGNRTPDALLRTEALYPLSYEGLKIDKRPNSAAGGA